jgi:hypothetical protein
MNSYVQFLEKKWHCAGKCLYIRISRSKNRRKMAKNGDFCMKITGKIVKITVAKIGVFACISVILR